MLILKFKRIINFSNDIDGFAINFAKDIPNYGNAYHKALTYANVSEFIIKELKFVEVRQEND